MSHAVGVNSLSEAFLCPVMEDVATPRTTVVLTDVLSEASRAGMQGWLEKRSGGKHGPGQQPSLSGLSSRSLTHLRIAGLKPFEHWDRRYFVLPRGSSRLSYYRGQEAFALGAAPLGHLSLEGATVDLVRVEHARLDHEQLTLHFTLCTAERDLQLKAPDAGVYEAWLKAIAAAGVELLENSVCAAAPRYSRRSPASRGLGGRGPVSTIPRRLAGRCAARMPHTHHLRRPPPPLTLTRCGGRC